MGTSRRELENIKGLFSSSFLLFESRNRKQCVLLNIVSLSLSLSLSNITLIHNSLHFKIFLIKSRLQGLKTGLFPSEILIQIPHVLLVFSMCTACPAHLTLSDFITRIILAETSSEGRLCYALLSFFILHTSVQSLHSCVLAHIPSRLVISYSKDGLPSPYRPQHRYKV